MAILETPYLNSQSLGAADVKPAWAARRAQLGIAGFCLALFLLLFNGRLGIIDGELMYRVAESLVERHSIAIRDDVYASKGKDGRSYSKYGPMQSLLAIPLYVVGRTAAAHAPGSVSSEQIKRAAVALFNPLVAALLCAAVFGLGLRLGLSPRRALGGALLTSFGTSLWYVTKTFNSEPLTALCLVLSFNQLLDFRRDRAAAPLLLSGLFLAMGVATRPVSLLAAPIWALYLWSLTRDERPALPIREWVLLAAPVALTMAGLACYNYARFGNPRETGYFQEGFSTPLWYGLAGLLWSPRCGILFYSPAVLLGIPGLRALARDHRREALTVGALCLIWLLASAAWWCWWGGWGVGPRLFMPVFPFLCVAGMRVLPAARATPRPVLAGLALLALLNVGLQAIPVLATHPEWHEIEVQAKQAGQEADQSYMWDFRYMPLAWQARHAAKVVLHQLTGRTKEVDFVVSREVGRDGTPELASAAAEDAQNSIFNRPVVDAWPSYLVLLGKSLKLVMVPVLVLLLGAAGCAATAWKSVRGLGSVPQASAA